MNLNFQADEAFKTELNKATFAWVDKLANSSTDSTSSSTDTETASAADSGISTSGEYDGSSL